MRAVRSVVLLMCPWLGAVALTGCTPPTPPPAPPPAPVAATPEQAQQAQADFARYNPNARVGHVVTVNGSANLVAVSGIPVTDVHHDDTLVFTDSKQTGVATGTIKQADVSTPEYPILIVEYTPTAGGRAPIRGDLAVYIPATPVH